MFKYIFFPIILALLLTSCGNKESNGKEDILVKVGAYSLSLTEVRDKLPSGLSPSDSIAFVESYINSWVNSKLMYDVAMTNIDVADEINEKVERYREELITYEYRKRMIHEHYEKNVNDDSLHLYYDKNINDFILQSPIIKGIYIKVSAKSPNVDKLKMWYKSKRKEDIDNIEKYGLNNVISYDYFFDRWVSMSVLTDKIPYDFGNVNTFLKQNKTLEVLINDYWYLLNITEYREKGDIMPYDFAKPQINEIFVENNKKRYDSELKKQLLDDAIKSGKVKFFYKQSNK